MSQEEAQNEKMIEFVRQKFGEDYAENPDMVRALYAKHHTAKTIVECIEGAQAELKVLVIKAWKPTTVKLCSKCGSKKCKETCGEEDYIDKYSYSFQAGDRSGIIAVRFPPWYDGDASKVVEEKVYVVKGKIGKYKEKYDITVEEFKEVVEDKSEKAVEIAKSALDVRKGSMNKLKFEDFMKQEGFGEYLQIVKDKLNLVEVGDLIKIGN